MNQAKKGDNVKVHYTGKLENGKVFDTTRDGQPIEFTIGSGRVIPGFEKAVIGLEAGDTKTIKVPPEEAFGPRKKELTVEVKKSDLPENITLSIGQQLRLPQPDGNDINLVITDTKEDTVTLDANHPLAGKTLTLSILLLEVT